MIHRHLVLTTTSKYNYLTVFEMALFKYFKKATVLPNPEGPLSDRMPSAAISSTNKEVKDLVVRETDAPIGNSITRKRGQYLAYIDEQNLRIAKRAVEFGVTFKQELAK